MSIREDDPSDPDAAEFRAAIGAVRRLPETPLPDRPRPRPVTRMREADERAALAESRRGDPARDAERMGVSVSYRRPEVSAETLRRLQRAEFAIDDEIDLRPTDARFAEQALRNFLADAREAGHGCLRIIHGQALPAPEQSQLRSMLERVLSQRANVLAFTSAPPSQGGSGATLLLIAKRKGP